MNKRIFLAAAASALPMLAVAASAYYSTSLPLIHKGGAVTMVKFQEVDRDEGNSIVEVSGLPSPSDLSSALLLSGVCGLAKARAEQFVQARQINKEPLTFEVTFPKTAPNQGALPTSALAPAVYPVSLCQG